MRELPNGYILENRYRILKHINSDLIGISYKAFDMTSKQNVKIKELFLKNISTREQNYSLSTIGTKRRDFLYYKKNLIDEMGILKLLNNDNIVKSFEFIEANNTIYSIEEYIKGAIRLDEYKDTFGDRETIIFLKDISIGLSALHNNQIIHRNIKPSNILYVNNRFILSDFASIKKFEKTDIILTNIGDVFYNAPEQFKTRGKIGEATDIYAMGATLFTLLSKRKIQDINRRKDEVHKELNENIFINKINRLKISDELKAIILKMLQFDYSKRYQNLRELKEDIDRLGDNPEDKFDYKKILYILIFLTILLSIFKTLPPPPPSPTPTIIPSNSIKFSKISAEKMRWDEAKNYCKQLNQELPTIKELKSQESMTRSVSYWSNTCYKSGLFEGNCEVGTFNKRGRMSSINKLKEEKFLVKCVKHFK